jgi:SAM-dependent methyltransferase
MAARAATPQSGRVKVLRRSAHLSYFRRGDEYYVYHDLWGYLLAMDRQVLDLLRAFQPEGARIDQVLGAFSGRLRPEQLEGYIATFRSHRCLVTLRRDEREDAFRRGHPVKAQWTVVWRKRPQEGDRREEAPAAAVLAYRDRALGRVVLERLDPLEAAFLERCDGEKATAVVAEELSERFGGGDLGPRIERLARRLAHSRRQVLKLSDRPLFEYLAYPPAYLRSTMPFERVSEAELDGGEPADADRDRDVVDLAAYHQGAIADAAAQFDVEETTLSHMFREPHPALGGRSYGEAFAEALLERRLVPGRGEIVEVGGGVGFFALRLLGALRERLPRRYERLGYTILDLSPVLQDSQRLLVSALGDKVRHLQANASVSLPFRDGTVGLVISNEVIADLETVRVTRTAVEAGEAPEGAPPPVREALAVIARYGLPTDDAPERFWLNLGALRLLEELQRVLVPGGAAVLTEFGELDAYPIESTHLGHSEFSIHFGHLMHVARALGFEVEQTDTMELLGMDGAVRVLATTRSYFVCLQALLQRRGVNLQKLAYTKEQFAELCGNRLDPGDLEGVRFYPVSERTLGLRPREFKVLVLRKPG